MWLAAKSYPLRVRGLKSFQEPRLKQTPMVVPLEGTWIEIGLPLRLYLQPAVVPLEGTWIEIHPLRVEHLSRRVVPLEGTWIEIVTNYTIVS